MFKFLKKFKKLSGGFTLIELLVVVSIIAFLSAVIILNSADSRAKARNAKRKSDLNTIASALESYYADYNGYPIGEGVYMWSSGGHTLQLNAFHNFAVSTNTIWNPNNLWLNDLIDKGYIGSTPVDPINLPGSATESGEGRFNIITDVYMWAPGLSYIYVNDSPYLSSEDECSSYDTSYGHAQKYKLAAATERPQADLDWRRDGGNFAYTFKIGSVGFEEQKLKIGEDIGLFYEVFSPGAQAWPTPRSQYSMQNAQDFDDFKGDTEFCEF